MKTIRGLQGRFACDSSPDVENETEDLIPLGMHLQDNSREGCLQYLRGIKDQVAKHGSDLAKRAWNSLYSAIRAGTEPRQALDSVRRMMVADSEPSDRARIDGDIFAREASRYLGQDVHTAERGRKKEQRNCRTFDSRKTDAENFLSAVEEMGDAMRETRWGGIER
jgi:hypothetical protein